MNRHEQKLQLKRLQTIALKLAKESKETINEDVRGFLTDAFFDTKQAIDEIHYNLNQGDN